MSAQRQGMPGATRVCPHCKATILESASVCPACRHHLRFDSDANALAAKRFSPLRVEGTIRHPPSDGAWEYSMVLSIKNDRGEEITRQVVGVGALFSGEERTFTLSVEAFEAVGYKAAGKGRLRR
ncbi:uncharacterized protein YbaR (Trm112 family) [Lysobacter enzymogenes]|uniref:Zinc ribbon domain-containing protein n=1 Tax=Lysobacter enzymogenes TaxID=69 RepID=A0AAU9AH15_LYSEN|nr:hypothetical protein [Lysobacter enzymogenes]BAV98527.1 conserved hypothetical protein [Lysobacter enzymogenes]SDX21921.1 hypothetical protein SAMN05421681_104259 [Lysobacter enzymogenes]